MYSKLAVQNKKERECFQEILINCRSPEAYLVRNRTSTMELFCDFKPLIIFAKKLHRRFSTEFKLRLWSQSFEIWLEQIKMKQVVVVFTK